MVITSRTRNAVVRSGHVGSNPTFSARKACNCNDCRLLNFLETACIGEHDDILWAIISRIRASEFFESGMRDKLEAGKFSALMAIHMYLLVP